MINQQLIHDKSTINPEEIHDKFKNLKNEYILNGMMTKTGARTPNAKTYNVLF